MSKVRSLVVATTLTVVASFVGGCVVHGRTHVRAGVAVEEPGALVEVSPGVWVVEDYHEPVFYSDGYYWAYRGGIWYRSSYYDYGFTRVRAVPRRVRSIRSPRRYVRYRSRGNVRTRAIRSNHRYHRSNTRDHRRRPTRDNRSYRGRDNRNYDRGRPARDHRGRSYDRRRTRDHRDRGRSYDRRDTRSRTRDKRDKRKRKGKDRRRTRDKRDY